MVSRYNSAKISWQKCKMQLTKEEPTCETKLKMLAFTSKSILKDYTRIIHEVKVLHIKARKVYNSLSCQTNRNIQNQKEVVIKQHRNYLFPTIYQF